MATAQDGDMVSIHYKGTFDDGEVFDASEGRDPLKFVIGKGHVIEGFNNAISGMAVEEKKTIVLEPADAYGERRDELQIKVPRSDMPEGINPEPGQMLQMSQPNGMMVPVNVTAVSDEEVTLDANHPLAGKRLRFDLELVKIEEDDGSMDQGHGHDHDHEHGEGCGCDH